jgi:UDP:flavonoid glycosyltransferase YjiC (YdhE family)
MAATSARRILFVTWDGGGNVNPLLALGPRLAATGWEVHAYGPPSLAARFAAEGVDYVSREVDDPWDVAAMARDVRQHCGRIGPDATVVDYMLPGALCGTEAAGRPTAALVHTLHRALLVDRAPGPIEMAASVDDLAAARRSVGLDELGSFGDLLDRCARVLVTCPAELDLPADQARSGAVGANVRYVGPVLEPAGPDAGWSRPEGTGRPLVVVSLGTTPMDERPLLERVLTAAAALPVDVVATVGDHLDAQEIAAVAPTNATVTGYVRHAALLPGAALLVTHAGLGTVLAGLAHGLPLLCLPLGREQPDNAAAVVQAGAGRTLPPDSTVDELRAGLVDVLEAPQLRTAATRMAATIGACAGRIESELDTLAEMASTAATE